MYCFFPLLTHILPVSLLTYSILMVVGVPIVLFFFILAVFEPRYEKTVFLHMLKQRRRSALR